MIYLITGTDNNYYKKIRPYLQTIEDNSPFQNLLLTIGFIQISEFFNIKNIYLPNEVFTNITTNPCVQAGEFLDHCKFLHDEDTVIFTDGDIRMQREISASELDLVNSLEQNEVLIGPNATHDDNTLLNELRNIQCTLPMEFLDPMFNFAGVDKNSRTLNCGVMIMKVKTYKEVHKRTYDLFESFPNLTQHMARQQFYLNLAIYSFCRVKLLPYTFHSHPHNGSQPGLNFKDDKVFINNELVLFNHKYLM